MLAGSIALRIAISEGSIGWVPYLMERADFSNWRHKAWTHSRLQNLKPSGIIRRHFMHCFLFDPYGLRNLKDVGEDMVSYELDYPHSGALWPDAPEHLWETAKHLTDEQIDKITHLNAIRFFRFDDMFKHYRREELTVGPLRAKAKAKGVDTTPKSSGGLRPTEDRRPVTSGDIMAMSKKHAEARTAAE
ncbi:MAG: amidohydrolase family protein [Rhizomicrobium sp.]